VWYDRDQKDSIKGKLPELLYISRRVHATDDLVCIHQHLTPTLPLPDIGNTHGILGIPDPNFDSGAKNQILLLLWTGNNRKSEVL
jgi:hypothetical protein